jgi:microcystin-dependent protein
MPATITFTRPSFGENDTLPPSAFNACTVLSGTVPDAEAGAYGVMRLAGDLTGTAASPQLTATGATAGSYGVNVLAIPQLTVDAKGRITSVADRQLGTAYGKTVIESADEAAARTVLGLGGTTFLDAVYVAVMSRQYPVGEMLITRRSANPSTWLGFGTWEAYGQGKTLVGLNAAEAEFDSLDKTGGAKTHTLAAGEMPNHTHSLSSGVTTSVDGGHDHYLFSNQHLAGTNSDIADGSTVNDALAFSGHSGDFGYSMVRANRSNSTTIGKSSSVAGHSHTVTISGTTGSAGSGTAHNNLQPYITVYFWKRTA